MRHPDATPEANDGIDEPAPASDGASTVSRRSFVQLGAAAGALVALTPAACAPADGGSTGAGASSAGLAPDDFELSEITVDELQEGMASGRWSAVSITTLYLNRIAALDRDGPTLRSIIETNPDALAIAEELDQERAAGSLRGPLHGIPVLVKDNIATADRMNTTAGSLALEGAIPSQDSFVAKKLREAGAVILGKANLSEWANFRGNRSSSGWSARGGQCKNPYALDRNPCGSSSGSGAACSANFTALAIGTETNGSIVCPSHANGLVGIKPTVGLWSRSRIIPISSTQDTAGPMTRTVRDGAILLGALVGVDPEDEATAASEGNFHTDYTQFLDAGGLRGARIGVARQFFGFHERVDRHMEDAIAAMSAAGAEVVDPVEIATRAEMNAPSFQVMLFEYKDGLNKYFAQLGPEARIRSVADLIAFNLERADEELRYFDQAHLVEAEAKGPLTDPEYVRLRAEARRLSGEEGIDATMAEHRLDAIIAPTGSPAWTTDLVDGDRFLGGSSSPAAISGYPAITVPAGFVFGLPIGISFFGRAWSEPTLLRIAYSFEQSTRHRRAPRFLPTAEL